MNILIVDDQIYVLKGLINGLNFTKMGFEKVFTANNATEAKKIMQTNDISLLLSDIEMPGENGLSLCKWTSENYPSTIIILLSSHASFTYAKESLKIGCFDYIVQPAPHQEIEDVIMRAVSKFLSDKHKFDNNTVENLNYIVFNLFSHNPSNKIQSIESLNKMGYPINDNSNIKAIIIQIYPYSESKSPTLSDLPIFTKLLESARASFNSPEVYPLVCLNRYKQFVLLLVSNTTFFETVKPIAFKNFYNALCNEISPELSCYVTPNGQISSIKDTIYPGHQLFENNVAKKTGIYFFDSRVSTSGSTNISENIARWTNLLANNHFSLLEENILSYLNFNVSINKLNLDNLCEFHQQITKLFFLYCHQKNIDIIELFSDEYNYNDYMNSFKNVESLMNSITYIINSITFNSTAKETKDDVQHAKEYILANISNDISVKDAADYVHLSPEYFSKLFKKVTGENVKNYMLRIKVAAAKDLLKNPNIPVSMVALELGYNNFSHFTQMFKKHEGVTPSEYRRQFV